jgi:Na+-transporting methylmalonyl-CoA/oxaloacetate decarboxylase gamma subunit
MSKGFLLGILMVLGVLLYIISSVIRMSTNPPQQQQQQQPAAQTTGKPAEAPTKQEIEEMKKSALAARKAEAKAMEAAKKAAKQSKTPSYVIMPSDKWFKNGLDGETGLKVKQTSPNPNVWQ